MILKQSYIQKTEAKITSYLKDWNYEFSDEVYHKKNYELIKKVLRTLESGATFGLIAKFVTDYIWGDQQELEEAKKEFEDYKAKNEFMKIDEKLGYMIDKKSGKSVKVIYEIHKGRKVIPINEQEKYIAETILKARPVNQDKDLNKEIKN